MKSHFTRQFPAWLFLYSITTLSITVYAYSYYSLLERVSQQAARVTIISPMFLLLLPAFLPIMHLAYTIQRNKYPKSRDASLSTIKVAIALFLGLLAIGFLLDQYRKPKLEAAGYSRCRSQTQAGFRAIHLVYYRDPALCG